MPMKASVIMELHIINVEIAFVEQMELHTVESAHAHTHLLEPDAVVKGQ